MKSLYKELVKYAESDYYPFHMPGHKRKHSRCRLSDIYQLDITEIEGFDNLHHAEGLLLGLQKKAAQIYHAEESFFLINGSTGGILSAVSAVAQEGKKLLIARNCHKSVYHAVLLNRLRTEYLWPEIIEEFDIQGEITPVQVAESLKERNDHGDICGIVITSPTYDGVISDIQKIAEISHHYQIPLIVDEAHGAHFVLSEKAPRSAVECGADIVINSVHKTLPAMTQTALLHVQGKLVDRGKLKKYLTIYQSSSPSYILMASIDNCMDFIMEQGQERFDRLLKLREKVDERAAYFSHIKIFPVGENCDPGKLVISVKNTNMTGKELYDVLLGKYYLQMEMAAPTSVLGILTVMDSEEGVDRLLTALEELDRGLTGIKDKKMKEKSGVDAGCHGSSDDMPWLFAEYKEKQSALSIYEAEQMEKEWLPFSMAAGRVSGEFLYLYPPGIPLVVPGERMGKQLVQKIEEIRKEGLNLIGLSEKGAFCFCREEQFNGSIRDSQ